MAHPPAPAGSAPPAAPGRPAESRSRAVRIATGIVWLAVAAVAFVLVQRTLTFGTNALVDLAVYRGAVAQWAAGGSLYDYVYHSPSVRTSGLPFTYPPFAALLFWPLLGLSDAAAGAVFSAVSVAAVVGACTLAARRERVGRPASWLAAGVLGLLMLTSYPIVMGLVLGQASLVVFALTLTDAVARRSRWRGVLTGLAAAIKLAPLVFVVYYAVRRDWRAAGTALATFGVATALAWVVLPRDSVVFWTQRLAQTQRVGDLGEIRNKSLRGLLEHWLPGTPGLTLVWLVLGLALAAVALRHAARLDAAGQTLAAVAVVGCLSTAASPISWIHHLGWLVLAAWVLLRSGRLGWFVVGAGLAAALSIASPFGDFPGDRPTTADRLGQDVPTVAGLAVAALGLPGVARGARPVSPAGPARPPA